MSSRATAWVWNLSLPSSQKLVLLALAEQVDQNGRCYAGMTGVAAKCGMTRRNLILLIQKLEKAGFITSERHQIDGYWVENSYVLNIGQMAPPSLSEILSPASEKISLGGGENISLGSEEVSLGGSENISQPLINKKLLTKNIKNPSSSEKKFSDEDMRCAEWLYQHLKEFKPDCRLANLNTWANHVRLMRERDKRTHRQICELFRWTLKDAFWQDNVQCPETLRKKWDTLSSKQKKQAEKDKGAAVANDPLAAYTRRLIKQ